MLRVSVLIHQEVTLMNRRTIITVLATTTAVAMLAFGGSAATAATKAKPSAGARPAQAGQAGRPAQPPAPPFVKPAAKYLGMKPAAVMKQLKAKKTLAALATAKGKSVDGLKAAIIADAQAKLAKDVAADRIDQADAEERLADLEGRIDDIVSKPLPARGAGGGNCPNRPGAGGQGAQTGGTGYGTGTDAGTGTTTGTGGGTYL